MRRSLCTWQALAEFYRLQPCIADAAEAEAAEGASELEAAAAAAAAAGADQRRRQREWSVQHVLLPALK